ncbi:multidrug effflux MFS transporter [Rhodanobacter sp. C03]|uniref:multidrug effflux MFS transporter n=1 Tax=Rhodanobacter sp. C03 TaxID=1945858 RepID=UPI000986D849|nr:multidrug effflux MFS transporter [Rhodanobacter sp. C03]
MTTDEHLPRTSIMIIVLGAITAFDAMAIDLYLPGFRDIGSALGASPAAMQATLAAFVGGAAIGQLFYGPLADRIGRRAPLAMGMVLFVAASVLAALSWDVETLIVARGLQGLGAAAGLVIPRAIIADRYRGREIAKLFSALLQVMMIAPVLAPPIGGVLVAALGWEAIFWALGLFGVASLVALFALVPETLKTEGLATTGLRAALIDYAGFFKRGRLSWMMLSSAFSMAGLFAYIGSSSFVFVDHFGLSPFVYSLVLAGNAVGMVVVAQINVLLLGRWSERQILVSGLGLHGACCVALLVATLGFDAGLYVVGALIFLAMSTLSLTIGNGFALVMQNAPVRLAGSVSSLLGVAQYALAGIAGVVLAIAYDATLTPFILTLLACAAAALLTLAIAMRMPAEPARLLEDRAPEHK